MAPMLVAFGFGSSKYLVPLGPGGFFYSVLFLPALLRGRFLMGSILVALGLGFYLMGGNVVPTAWVAIVFTFLVAVNLSFLSGWKVADWTMGGTLALTFIVIYTAGLNSGSPEATSKNFIAFTGVPGLVGCDLAAAGVAAGPAATRRNARTDRRAGRPHGHRHLGRVEVRMAGLVVLGRLGIPAWGPLRLSRRSSRGR
jgi:hypothetical protein